jgi:hypothetical protein
MFLSQTCIQITDILQQSALKTAQERNKPPSENPSETPDSTRLF